VGKLGSQEGQKLLLIREGLNFSGKGFKAKVSLGMRVKGT